MVLKELTNQEFKNFTNNFKQNSIYQTVEYGLVMNHQNFDSVFLGLVDSNNEILAASLFLIEQNEKYKYAYVPRGFLIDYHDEHLLSIYVKEIKNYFKKHGIAAIRINPQILKTTYDLKFNVVTKNEEFEQILKSLTKLGFEHMGYNHFFEDLKPRFEAVIDLNYPYYYLFQNIKKQFKTKIRSAANNGINIYKGNEEDLKYLYGQTKQKYPRNLNYFKDCYHYWTSNKAEMYYAKLDTKTFLSKIQKLYQEKEIIRNNLNIELSKKRKDNLKLITQKMEADKDVNKYHNLLIKATKFITEYPQGIVLASVLVLKEHDTVYLLMDGYDKNYKSFNAKHLLIWKLMEQYSKQGYKKFNLGGITDILYPNNPYQGLNEFKTNFHALVLEYIGDFELVTNNKVYFMHQRSKDIKSILKK